MQAREAIHASGRALVVEGYMDVVALAQFEIGYAVATLGTATTPVHVSKLLKLADEIVFCFDGDAAGRKAAWRALEVSLPLALDHKPVRFLFLPDGEDPDTYVRRHGKEAFEQLARGAQNLSEFLLGELRSQANLGTAEGRARFITLAKPYLGKIEARALKLQLLKEIARSADVTQEEAAETLLPPPAQPAYRRPAPARRTFNPPSSGEWKLLARVAAYPTLARELDPSVLDMQLPESAALKEVADWQQGKRDTAALSHPMFIEQFRDSTHADMLFQAQAFAIELGETEEQARLYFRHSLWKLDIERKNEQIKALTERLTRGQLSKDEHTEYGKMIAEVKALEQRLQTEGRSAAQ